MSLARPIYSCYLPVAKAKPESSFSLTGYDPTDLSSYISLLTIGYGDLSPKSNPGRCFFVIWSLISVPTMTILVSDLGDTVVAKFKKWSNTVADFTVLPKRDIWQPFVDKNYWLQQRIQNHREKHRVREGFSTTNPNDGDDIDNDNDIEVVADTLQANNPNITSLAEEAETDLTLAPTQASLSRRIALSIKKVSFDLRLDEPKRYSYEEWVEFTRLIRYTTPRRLNRVLGTTLTNETENEEGLVNWDWLGEHSPMVAGVSESEWLLERLVESLIRLEKRRELASDQGDLGRMRCMECRPTTVGLDGRELGHDEDHDREHDHSSEHNHDQDQDQDQNHDTMRTKTERPD